MSKITSIIIAIAVVAILAIGGRDAKQNESIVKKYLTPKRIFMHAEIHGAPVVIMFTEGKEPDEKDLTDAALLSAAYSKAWKLGIGTTNVYWVWGNQVSKSPPPGEYLTKGSFMVYGKRNYIKNIELKIAIGIELTNNQPRIIVGTPENIAKKTIVYATLIPGDNDPSKTAHKLKKLLSSKLPEELQGIIDAIGINEIIQRIPGKSRIIEALRGEKQ
jgi:hypothetical protein